MIASGSVSLYLSAREAGELIGAAETGIAHTISHATATRSFEEHRRIAL